MSKISELSDGGSLVSSDYLIAVRSGGNVKVRMDSINVDQVDLGDNEFIRLGNSQDLTMVHTSTQSIINQAGIGDLLLQKAGATKLTINATGIDVTGTVTADGLTVVGITTSSNGTYGTKLTYSNGNQSGIIDTFGNHNLEFRTNDDRAMNIASNGDISFYNTAGNSQALFWDASAESLGIGTSSPLSRLVASASDGGKGIELQPSTGSLQYIISYDRSATDYIDMQISAKNLIFGTDNGAEKMRILADGSVCQGNTVSLVASNYNNQAGAAWHKPDGHYEIATTGDRSALEIGKNNANDGSLVVFRKQSDEVGSIGINSANFKIQSGSAGYVSLDGEIQFLASKFTSVPRLEGATDDSVTLGYTNKRFKDLYLSGTAYAGSMGLGETSLTAKLHIKSDGAVSTLARMNNTAAGTAASNTIIFQRSGTNVGFIQVTGSATSYITSSDYRLKENVVAMSGATERLKQLKPSRFNFITDADTTVDGFLAHEVQDVVPEAISGTKDAMRDEEYEVTPAVLDDDGNVVTEAVMGTRSVPDYQGIDQSKLVPLLVATIQELEARIAALES